MVSLFTILLLSAAFVLAQNHELECQLTVPFYILEWKLLTNT
jgi:hypothetical protein